MLDKVTEIGCVSVLSFVELEHRTSSLMWAQKVLRGSTCDHVP